MSTYAAAVQSLLARAAELSSRRKFDPEHMRVLAQALGDPQKKFASILIAGTNGKGSTAATLASIIESANISVGLYTSPHLTRVNERIRIFSPGQGNDREPNICDEDFARFYFQVDGAANALVATGALPYQPSFFETVTAVAFLAFAALPVQIAVLEVGLGGRLDATNIVDPLLSVLTDIDMDHTEWLGPTITHIAREKAGIMRPNGLLITLPQHPEANQVIGEVATQLQVTAINAADYIPYKTSESENASSTSSFRNRYSLQVLGEQIEVDSPLSGQHQQRNIALAVAAAVALRNQHGYKITAADIARGIQHTEWPARLELLPAIERPADRHRPAILLDVAHNPAGAWTLRAAINSFETDRAAKPFSHKTLLFGCLADKPVDQLAQILFPLFDQIILTRPNSPRAAAPEELAALAANLGAPARVVDEPTAALDAAILITPQDGLLVIAGSVYLVGQLRPYLVP
jgi:dihydrofolate synthase/folylpolyglutamate synthase